MMAPRGTTIVSLIALFLFVRGVNYNPHACFLPPDDPLRLGLTPKLSITSENEISEGALSGRMWRNTRPTKMLSVYSSRNVMLYRLTLLGVDKNQEIYVLDYGDMKVKKFSRDGRFLGFIGKGKGKGPGEFVNPTDLGIDTLFNIWVSDAATGLLTCFDQRGNVVKTFRLKSVPFRVSLRENQEFIIQRPAGSDHLFELYDSTGNFKFSFGRGIIPEQSQSPILINGYMASSGSFLYFSFKYFGFIMCFDLDRRRIQYLVKTVDDIPTPKVDTRRVGDALVMKIASETPVASSGISLGEGKIFIKASARLASFEHVTIIDSYSRKDGRYLYSFKIPEALSTVHYDGKLLYGITDTSISKWVIPASE
jgi:hypothetical protein